MVKIMNMFVCGLALIFFTVGCGQDQERPTETKESAVKQSDETATKDSGMIEKMKSQAETIKEKTSSVIGDQVDKAKAVFDKGKEDEAIIEHGDEAATKADQTLKEESTKIGSMKDKTASIVKDLINKARAFFEQGKFKESIAAAQDILSNHDSDSQEAKDIITKAKEKLKELLEEQAKEKLETTTATDKAEDLKDNLTDKLKSFGQ
ncbi:MAG: hypothetical protein MRK02_01535 [Candidatus Scalindua sp.]|nr:hypothetical protein [Candidatus Scalindua sp.]